MPRTYVWWSESGGPGKTTNAMNSAAAIGRDGYDVLAIDLDPQRGALTHYAGYGHLDHDSDDQQVSPTVMDVFFGDVTPDEIIVETPYFDLMPGHESLANFDSKLDEAGFYGLDRFGVIRDVIEDLADEYDYFLVDCNAALGELVDNAVFAARNVMVPLELSPKGRASQKGLEATIEAMSSGFEGVGVDIAIAGVVPSRVGNAKIFEEYREEFEEDEIPVSPFSIPEHSLLRYTWDNHMDIFQFLDSEETRDLRKYEEHVPLAFKVIGRWMTGDYSYSKAVEKWDAVKDQRMGDAEPEKLLDEDSSATEVDA
ncbi:chromosome partitioning protein [Halorientalis persicus]|uniref:Chromosome partitioning protein n=1 Tax=Halorientalis persicus TaxID=1367881 RepID=A0A1H8WLI2_9EURY|nr:ParA family protein [Halorientalis persicus]SEP28511.1 chromosome partitioning protein [Halorientalis persicus]